MPSTAFNLGEHISRTHRRVDVWDPKEIVASWWLFHMQGTVLIFFGLEK